MDTVQAWGVVAEAFTEKGNLSAEREVELGLAFTTIGSGITTSFARIADALEKLAQPVDDIVSGEQLDEGWIGRLVQQVVDERLREAGRARV